MTQDHATNLRDLILNYELDKEDKRIIDFTYGTGSMWKTEYAYKFKLTKCDAVPTSEGIIRKNLLEDDYSDLGLHDAAVFDPPYLYGHQAFDYSLKPMGLQGKNSWNKNGELDRFTANKNKRVFTDRVDGVNRAALQVLKPESLLFVKVMDVRKNGDLVLNHALVNEHLTYFKCYAMFVYLAGGAKTWKSHAESAHGYWMVFKLVKDTK